MLINWRIHLRMRLLCDLSKNSFLSNVSSVTVRIIHVKGECLCEFNRFNKVKFG